MKDRLLKIRAPKPISNRWACVIWSVLFLLLGAALGAFAKWLDNISLESGVWWHRAIEALDLGNVFSGMAIWLLIALIISVFSRTPARAAINTFLFFLGMCAAYHAYTLVFSGFDPTRYMLVWYAITLLSPLLAAVCWYGRGTGPVAVAIDSVIIAVMAVFCFSIGWFYFGFNGVVNAVIFIAAAAVLYRSPKQLLILLVTGAALAFLIAPIVPFAG